MEGDWNNFFIAEVGATAALAGLVIVAISINLKPILPSRQLSGRAAETFMILVGALVLSSLCLMPQSPQSLAIEIIVIAFAIWLLPVTMQVRSYNPADPKHWSITRALVTQGATLPMLVAGILLLLGHPAGIDWLAAGILAAIVGSIINTWVLLVEILR